MNSINHHRVIALVLQWFHSPTGWVTLRSVKRCRVFMVCCFVFLSFAQNMPPSVSQEVRVSPGSPVPVMPPTWTPDMSPAEAAALSGEVRRFGGPLPPQIPGPVAPFHPPMPVPPIPEQITSGHSIFSDRDGADRPLMSNESDPVNRWLEQISVPLRNGQYTLPVDVSSLFRMATQHSERIAAVRQTPWISETQVLQASGAFDAKVFTKTDFTSTSDPVESVLVTGGPPRLEDNIVGFDGGVRKLMSDGSSYTVGQRLGHRNSNSLFIDPNNQATSRLYATWTRPLQRGRRQNPQQSLVLKKQFDTAAEQASYRQAVQAQLFDIANAYWGLYQERGTLLLKQRNLQRAEEIASQLVGRQTLDTVRSQLLRTQAAVTNRKAELFLCEAKIRNVESRLRALSNSPEFSGMHAVELLPVQIPDVRPLALDTEAEVGRALVKRPEIRELRDRVQGKMIQLALACDQTKARLDFVLEGNVAGLDRRSDIAGSWARQFTTGRPGFGVGLEFEMPYQNRTAHGALRQRRLELNQLRHQIRELEGNARAEVEVAMRNLQAAFETSIARRKSVNAASAEVQYLRDRWLTLGANQQSGDSQLNDLLEAHDRLLEEELSLLRSCVRHSQSFLELQRATGSLIEFLPAGTL